MAEQQGQAPQSPPSRQYTPELSGTPESVLAELGIAAEAPVEEVVQAQELAPEPPAQAAPPAPQTSPAAPPDPKLQALIDREANIVSKEQTIKEYEESIRQLQSRMSEYESAKAAFAADPVSYIRSLVPDIDLDDLAKTLWYERLGSAAPPEYRAIKEARAARVDALKSRSAFETLQKRTAEDDARKQADAAEAQYVDGLRGYLASVPSSFPLVQHLATQKPDVAVRMMHDAARMIAPGLGRRPTTEEAAQAVQKYLDEIGYVAPAPVPAAPTQTPASAPATPPTTIRNSHSAVQPGRVPPDPNDPRVLRKQGLQAMAEALGDPSLADIPVW